MLGNRTRDLNEAHVEYLRGIENPIGIKIGPPYTIDEILKLIEKLNPTNEAGKLYSSHVLEKSSSKRTSWSHTGGS